MSLDRQGLGLRMPMDIFLLYKTLCFWLNLQKWDQKPKQQIYFMGCRMFISEKPSGYRQEKSEEYSIREENGTNL